MAIEWQDSYKLGDSEIDAQHHRLFGLVNILFSTTEKYDLTEALANLLRHTQDHFAHEENSMSRLDYPGMKAHVEQHNTLLAKLANVSEIIANYSLDMANLESFLSAWLLNHMETLDAQFVSYLRRQ
jgi:hemerythrin